MATQAILYSYQPSSRSIRGNICSDVQGVWTERSERLERQNKYFPYGPRSRLIRALLYIHINKLIFHAI